MEEKAAYAPSNDDENDSLRGLSDMLSDGLPIETCWGFNSLPEHLRLIVTDYISDDKKNRQKLALLGKPYVTLCLSQHTNLKLGRCWQFGCLSPEDRWESSMKDRVDKRCNIKDYQGCLDFLSLENLSHFPFVIKVLIFQLDMSSQDVSNALDDLQGTLVMLQEYLIKVHHVVLAIDEHTFCCFSFNDIIDKATRRRQAFNRPFALKQIIDDLRTCWEAQHKLDAKLLLDYYILKDDKPVSEVCLSKFVVSLNHLHSKELFDTVDPALKYDKLKWICDFGSPYDLNHINEKMILRCHAIHLDASSGRKVPSPLFLEQAFSLKDNPFIERIVIYSASYRHVIQLPRPSASLTGASPRSALIEFSLNGNLNTFDLTQLNTGYFLHLAHVCVVGATMMGYLDSQNVPSLRTLSIELGSEFERSESTAGPLLREHTQSLIVNGYPWQLIATKEPGGWSLASYDEPTANPQEEVKDDSLHSLPIIRELMLVMCWQSNAIEFQSRLNGNPPLKAAAENQNDGLLVWAPDRVEKITAFCPSTSDPQLEFKEEIPGKTRILASLACHGIGVELRGATLPLLQLLKVNRGEVRLSGAFPHLQLLSFENAHLQSPWQLDARMLQSLHCNRLYNASRLLVRPRLLPQLSYLWIKLPNEYPLHRPSIFVADGDLGLSHVNHVVFNTDITKFPLFDQLQVNNASHLEMTVNPMTLSTCWFTQVWQCETLTINLMNDRLELFPLQDTSEIKLPPQLPLLKKLTVISTTCPVVYDSEMPELMYCSVPYPRSLGPGLKCPALRSVCFTGKLTASDREKCLDRATYKAMGAQPEWIYFGDTGEVKRMSWDVALNATGVSSIAGLLDDGENYFVTPE